MPSSTSTSGCGCHSRQEWWSCVSPVLVRCPRERTDSFNDGQTVEPGCYFSPHLLASVRNSPYIEADVLSRYEPVGGVRIEDVIAITTDGYEVLTTVGKDVEWVEGVCSGSL